MRHSEGEFVHRLRQRRKLASLSRSGLANDFMNPISKHEEYSEVQSKALTPVRKVYFSKPKTPLNVRVSRALAAEATIHTDLEAPTVRHSATFLSISREYLQGLMHPQAPPIGCYNPRYSQSMKLGPSVGFPRAQRRRKEQEVRSASEEPRMFPETGFRPRFRGVSFEKQTKREMMSSTGPHEARFAHYPQSSSPETRQVHSFAAYSPRKELFPLPQHLPDYSPRYSFLSRRKIPA